MGIDSGPLQPPSADRVYDIGPLTEVPFETKKRETVRERLATNLTYTVIATVIIPLITVAIFPERAAMMKELAPIIISPLIGVYGTVLGFYFGQQK
jgi:hypothetical protein